MIKNSKTKTLIKIFTLLIITNGKTLLKKFKFTILVILNTYNRASYFPPLFMTSPTISINKILTSKAIASFNMVIFKRII